MKKICLLVLLLVLSKFLWASSPWAIGKGNGYFQPGITTKSWTGRYEGTFAHSMIRDLNREITQTNISFYAEYGISAKLTLIADANYRLISSSGTLENATKNPYPKVLEAGSLFAPGNPEIQLKYQLTNGLLYFAIYQKYQPNVSSGKPNIGLQTDYNASTYITGISIGQDFEKAFWSGDIGFSARANSYSESLQGNWQYAHLIVPKTYLIFEINCVATFGNGHYKPYSCYEQTALYIDKQGYIAYGAKIYAQVYKNLIFNLAFYSSFAVVNQGNQLTNVFGSLAYKLNKKP